MGISSGISDGLGLGITRGQGGIGVLDFRAFMPPEVTYSRTGPATALTSAGVLTAFADNEPQRTDRGLVLEPARTQTAGNNSFAGVSAGALTTNTPFGTGGWLNPVITSGMTVTVLGTGSTNGVAWIDIRVQGTPAGSPHFSLEYQTAALSPAAAIDQTWVNSIYAAVVGGSVANNGSITLRGYARNGSTVLATRIGNDIRSSLTSSLQRFDASLTLQSATTDKSTGLIAFSGSGVALDYTIRLGLPGWQLGATLRSPIITSGTVQTRGLPTCTAPVPGGRTQARLTYADGSTSTSTGLTPGATFDITAAALAADKARFNASELQRLDWLP